MSLSRNSVADSILFLLCCVVCDFVNTRLERGSSRHHSNREMLNHWTKRKDGTRNVCMSFSSVSCCAQTSCLDDREPARPAGFHTSLTLKMDGARRCTPVSLRFRVVTKDCHPVILVFAVFFFGSPLNCLINRADCDEM